MEHEKRNNPHFNPDLGMSLAQERLRKQRVENRRQTVQAKLAEAQEVANSLGAPIQYILFDRPNVVVIPRKEDMHPQEIQTQNQEPTEQG